MSPNNDKGESLSDSTTTIPDSINAESDSNTQLSMLSSPSIADSNTSFVPNTQSNLGIPETPDQHVYKNKTSQPVMMVTTVTAFQHLGL